MSQNAENIEKKKHRMKEKGMAGLMYSGWAFSFLFSRLLLMGNT